MISTQDIQFIEANRHHYDTWVKAQYVKHLDGATRSTMLAIIRKYFAPNYVADLWCQSCVSGMLVYLYTQYDNTNKQPTAKPMPVQNDIDLIGDFIGTIPAITALATKQPVTMHIKQGISSVAALIAPVNGLTVTTQSCNAADITFNLQGAFNYADKHNLHMIQAHYASLGLPVPADIPRPTLQFAVEDVPVFDYVIAPFSRSLPVEQKWQQYKWQQLVDSMPGKTFCLFGAKQFDDAQFITGPNVTPVFDAAFTTVCNIMQRSRHGVISVVTGISHLAYALAVKNYLFVNQGAWGKNPEAVMLTKHIPGISVDEVLQVLNNY